MNVGRLLARAVGLERSANVIADVRIAGGSGTHERLPSGTPSPELEVAAESRRCPQPSFEQLYADHAALTWRALRHLVLTDSEVEDAMQDLWVIVHRRLPSFEGRSSMESWLFGIAVNVARRYRRSEKRRPRGEPLPPTLPDTRAESSDREGRREAFELVQRYLDTLDDRRREIFVCNLLEGMSAPETALATGAALSLVQNRIRALRRSFKTWLERRSTVS